MERDEGHVYVTYDYGEDVPTVLRRIADGIVNGRIECNGVEVREDDTYWVKDCGKYEIAVPMPYEEGQGLTFDVYGRHAMKVDVRKKNG